MILLKGRISSEVSGSKSRKAFLIKTDEFVKDGQVFMLTNDIRVSIFTDKEISYGDTILAEGRLFTIKGKPVLAGKKTSVFLVVKKAGFSFEGLALYLKTRAKEKIDNYFEPGYRGILKAILLGEAGLVPAKLKTDMIATGTWHLMVVSGSHAALLAYILILVFKILGIKRGLRFFMVIFLLVLYCVITGASSPVVRATVMASCLLLTYMLERNPDFLNSLALSALIILIFDPRELFMTGFQLSFISVFAIFLLFPVLRPYFINIRMPVMFQNSFCVSLCAWLGTTPLLFLKFKSISLIAILANVVAAPLSSLVVAGGMVFLFLSSICQAGAFYSSYACRFLLDILCIFCSFSAKIPFAFLSFSY